MTRTQANLLLVVLMFLSLGVVAVGIGMYIGWSQFQISTRGAEEVMTVYEVARALEPGTSLREEDLRERQVSKAFQVNYRNAVTPEQIARFIGIPLPTRIEQGAILTFEAFSVPEPRVASTPSVAHGKRAVTLPVSDSQNIPFLSNGDRVDLQVTVTPPSMPTTSYLVMERVKVLSVGHRRGRSGTSYDTITVEVTPAESRALSSILRHAEASNYTLIYRDVTDTTLEIASGTINPELLQVLSLPMVETDE